MNALVAGILSVFLVLAGGFALALLVPARAADDEEASDVT